MQAALLAVGGSVDQLAAVNAAQFAVVPSTVLPQLSVETPQIQAFPRNGC